MISELGAEVFGGGEGFQGEKGRSGTGFVSTLRVRNDNSGRMLLIRSEISVAADQKPALGHDTVVTS